MQKLLPLLGAAVAVGAASAAPDSPIIGVLAVPVDHGDCVTLNAGNGGGSCFHTLYVKWLEAAGARVVPLPYDLPGAAFALLLESLNGALITGGETDLSNITSPYMSAASRLYQHALAAHNGGEVWPLWGTCMGMQVLSILGAGDPSVLLSSAYDSESLQLPLALTPAAATSALLCPTCLPGDTLSVLTTVNSTVNLHHDGVPPEAFAGGSSLGAAFQVLSTNVDRKGKAFVSSMEAAGGAKIFAVQWHPERPQFEWKGDQDFMDHSAPVVSAMFAVSAKFVYFARCNNRRFSHQAAEAAALIYNYVPVGRTSYQAYFFPPRLTR